MRKVWFVIVVLALLCAACASTTTTTNTAVNTGDGGVAIADSGGTSMMVYNKEPTNWASKNLQFEEGVQTINSGTFELVFDNFYGYYYINDTERGYTDGYVYTNSYLVVKTRGTTHYIKCAEKTTEVRKCFLIAEAIIEKQ